MDRKLTEIVNNGKIEGISDIRDESDRDGMKIVIELKKDTNPEIIISNLYKKTSLQSNFGAIFLALVNGKPFQLSLRKYLTNFLEFREETIRKRTNYFLKITINKLEILEGFSTATKNIKRIVDIIQNSENIAEAESLLVQNLSLTKNQANAVLSMPLKKLTNLERKQIEIDIEELSKNKTYLSDLLNERTLLLKKLVKEFQILKNTFNVERKTKILKDINQENEMNHINTKILEELINKKTKISIDNRLYIKKVFFNNYKKLIDTENKIIDNKTLQKFLCNIHKSLKIIGVTVSGKVFHVNWEKNLNNDFKLDNKILGNPNEQKIINFHNYNQDSKSIYVF